MVCYSPGIHGTVRLIGGLIPEEGTVEVCMNAVWSSVCDSSWDYKDAFVVCRQLRYPATGENNGEHSSFPCGSKLQSHSELQMNVLQDEPMRYVVLIAFVWLSCNI